MPKNRKSLKNDRPQYPTSNIASTKNVRRLPRRRITTIHLPSFSLRSLPNISPMTPPHTKIIRLLFILYSLQTRKTLYFSLYISIFLLSSSSEVLYFIEIASFSPKFRLKKWKPMIFYGVSHCFLFYWRLCTYIMRSKRSVPEAPSLLQKNKLIKRSFFHTATMESLEKGDNCFGKANLQQK